MRTTDQDAPDGAASPHAGRAEEAPEVTVAADHAELAQVLATASRAASPATAVPPAPAPTTPTPPPPPPPPPAVAAPAAPRATDDAAGGRSAPSPRLITAVPGVAQASPRDAARGGEPGTRAPVVAHTGARGAPVRVDRVAAPPAGWLHPAADPDDPSRGALPPLPEAPLDTQAQVPTISCPAGHGNPPHAVACRRCSAPLDDQPAVLRERPVVAHLRCSDGSTVPLDRPVVLGRRPRDPLPGGHPGPVRLHRLHADDDALADTHTLLTLEGWSLAAVDLGAIAGTTVTLPSQPTLRLAPGAPAPVVLGSRVQLTEGVWATVEPAG